MKKQLISACIIALAIGSMSFARVSYTTEMIGENTMRINLQDSENKPVQSVSYIKENTKSLQLFYNYSQGDNYIDVDLRTMTPPIKITLVDLDNLDNNVLFTDLDTSKYKDFVKHLYDMNVISGYEDGTFRAENPVTRAEFATMILKSKGIQISQGESNPFSDIDGHWAKDIILTAYKNGIIKGYQDGTFRPNDTVTLAEVCVMINTTFDFESVGTTDVVIGTHWAKDVVTKMYEIEILNNEDGLIELNKEMNRGDCAMLLSRAVVTR